jgi:hypothetical protein
MSPSRTAKIKDDMLPRCRVHTDYHQALAMQQAVDHVARHSHLVYPPRIRWIGSASLQNKQCALAARRGLQVHPHPFLTVAPSGRLAHPVCACVLLLMCARLTLSRTRLHLCSAKMAQGCVCGRCTRDESKRRQPRRASLKAHAVPWGRAAGSINPLDR